MANVSSGDAEWGSLTGLDKVFCTSFK